MAVDHKPLVGNLKMFNKYNYLQQKRNVICISYIQEINLEHAKYRFLY
jgi:hypothetical protein